MFSYLSRKTFIILFILTFTYLFIRLFQIEEHVNYSDEQGKFLLTTYEIWRDKNPTLLGPATSFNYDGRYFFQGPLMYYLLIPSLILGGWDPLYGSYLIVLLNLFAVYLIFFSLKKIFNEIAAFASAILFAVMPDTVYYTQFVWNPNFLPIISSIVLALLVNLWGMSMKVRVLFVGFFLGIGLQFHYQIVPLSFLVVGYLVIFKKIKIKEITLILLGFGVGYFPIILFELRNNFYNTQTIILLLRNGVFVEREGFPSYYLLSFYPFVLVLFGLMIFLLQKKYKILTYLFVSLLIIGCLLLDYFQVKNLRGLPDGWRLSYAKETAEIIANENPKDFNTVNLLSGDTRAYQIRYLLTVQGLKPMGVEEYPKAKKLFVLTKDSKEKIKENPVWEIQSFKPFEISKEWSVGNSFYLYQLKSSKE